MVAYSHHETEWSVDGERMKNFKKHVTKWINSK